MASPDDAETTAPRRQAAARKTRFMRSRVGNGKTLMAGVDQRSLPYREFQDTVADLTHHMGGSQTGREHGSLRLYKDDWAIDCEHPGRDHRSLERSIEVVYRRPNRRHHRRRSTHNGEYPVSPGNVAGTL